MYDNNTIQFQSDGKLSKYTIGVDLNKKELKQMCMKTLSVNIIQ